MKTFLLRLFGKKIDAALASYGISKTKVAMVIAIVLPAIEQISGAVGHPIVFPDDLKQALMAVGLWSLKDGLDGPMKPKTEEKQNA